MSPQRTQWVNPSDNFLYPVEKCEELCSHFQRDECTIVPPQNLSFLCCHSIVDCIDQDMWKANQCQPQSTSQSTSAELTSDQIKMRSKSSAQSKVKVNMGVEMEQNTKRVRTLAYTGEIVSPQYSSVEIASERSWRGNNEYTNKEVGSAAIYSEVNGYKDQRKDVSNKINNSPDNSPDNNDECSLNWLATDQLADESEGLGRFRFWNWSNDVQCDSSNSYEAPFGEWSNELPIKCSERKETTDFENKNMFSRARNSEVDKWHNQTRRIQESIDVAHESKENIEWDLEVSKNTHQDTPGNDIFLVQEAFDMALKCSKDPSIIEAIERQFGNNIDDTDDQRSDDIEFERYRRCVLNNVDTGQEQRNNLEEYDAYGPKIMPKEEDSTKELSPEREFGSKYLDENCIPMSGVIWAEHPQLENEFQNHVRNASSQSDSVKSENGADTNVVCEWFDKLLDGTSDATNTERDETSHYLPLTEAARRDCISFFSMPSLKDL